VVLSQIEHLVVVMLENRSLDHMLGSLYAAAGNRSPTGQAYDGLTGRETNPDGQGVPIGAYEIQASDPHPYFMPGADPGEGFLNTNAQLYGTTQPPPNAPATNRGFVQNFAAVLQDASRRPGEVMAGTTPADVMAMYPSRLLPVLSGLAAGFAVSDRWFASVPTETLPNRAFTHMATSQGHMSDRLAKAFTAPSIFPALQNAGATWSVYGYDGPPLTRGSVADITTAPEEHFGEFSDFQAAANGTLANYAFLEPRFGSSGNSQHPNYNVAVGEQFLYDIYYALRRSPLWTQSLLVITYDEHGGCFDHVPPPTNAVPPDDTPGELGFGFQRFGVRVPTVLVSPWIARGTVLRPPGATPFDHTSVLATLEHRFGVPPLTRRDAAAPDVAGVLTLGEPRSDDPLATVKVPVAGPLPAPARAPDHLELTIAELAGQLPGAPYDRLGEPNELGPFARGPDCLDFARARYRAYAEGRRR
jgi:phospholipase C